MNVARWRTWFALSSLALVACSGSSAEVAGSADTGTSTASVATDPVVGQTRFTIAGVDAHDTGWLYVGIDGAIFMTFVRDTTGHLTGTMQIAQPNASGTAIEPSSYPLTGTIDGESVAVSFADKTWTGSISGGSLFLNVPRDDGTIGRALFTHGSVDDYNAAVAHLQQGAQSASAVSIADAQQAATASSIQAAADREAARINSIYRAVLSDVSSLNSAIADLPAALAEVDAAVGLVQTAADDPAITTGDCSDSAYALSNVEYEVSGVGYATSGVDYVTVNMPSQITDLQQQAAALKPVAQTDAQLDAVTQANSTIQTATTALDNANKATSKAADTANSIYVGAQQAEATHCPGG